MEQISKYCRYCKQHTIHQRQGVNHILHLLITVLTCGLWVIIWVLLIWFNIGGWHCRKCMG